MFWEEKKNEKKKDGGIFTGTYFGKLMSWLL